MLLPHVACTLQQGMVFYTGTVTVYTGTVTVDTGAYFYHTGKYCWVHVINDCNDIYF